jgi:hypothetical protein
MTPEHVPDVKVPAAVVSQWLPFLIPQESGGGATDRPPRTFRGRAPSPRRGGSCDPLADAGRAGADSKAA